MGSGKSIVGRLLAHLLGFGFIDTDAEVEARARKSVARIFKDQGEPAFREIERKVVMRAAGARHHVIATGGGAVEDAEAWNALKANGIVVWLNPSIEEVVRRIVPGPAALHALADRPFLEDLADVSGLAPGTKGPALREFMEDKRKRLAERLRALLGSRIARYREADLVVEPAWELPETTARDIAKRLRAMES
ncbi:shikimate kinase [bacterium]|nr:shikimate kinase [bacterium]